MSASSSAQPYSAREAIARALLEYQRALQEYQQREQRASAEQQAAFDAARQKYQALEKQLRAEHTNRKAHAAKMVAEAEALSREADKAVHDALLDELLRQPINAPAPPTGASKPHPQQELQRAYSQAYAADTDLKRVLVLLAKARAQILVRLRKRLHLPP
ncbi:MAG: hypothetical protein B6D41_02600 [Chloroflexi bacterium UTCFX4]|jgi:DNA repair exonuclease SbcCD ATPase subunit|nr:MAG: hypothetical protein B6D41_02600 [Chloroflexi bacterium UTCFX4]